MMEFALFLEVPVSSPLPPHVEIIYIISTSGAAWRAGNILIKREPSIDIYRVLFRSFLFSFYVSILRFYFALFLREGIVSGHFNYSYSTVAGGFGV